MARRTPPACTRRGAASSGAGGATTLSGAPVGWRGTAWRAMRRRPATPTRQRAVSRGDRRRGLATCGTRGKCGGTGFQAVRSRPATARPPSGVLYSIEVHPRSGLSLINAGHPAEPTKLRRIELRPKGGSRGPCAGALETTCPYTLLKAIYPLSARDARVHERRAKFKPSPGGIADPVRAHGRRASDAVQKGPKHAKLRDPGQWLTGRREAELRHIGGGVAQHDVFGGKGGRCEAGGPCFLLRRGR